MSNLLPEGEELRRALRWVSAKIQEETGAPVQQLVHQAIARFDLSPRDAESLIYFYKERKEEM